MADRCSHQGAALAGFFIGMGGFQLFDGIVDHKILRLHQIRYGIDNLLLYDIVWDTAGAILLLAGLVLSRRVATAAATTP